MRTDDEMAYGVGNLEQSYKLDICVNPNLGSMGWLLKIRSMAAAGGSATSPPSRVSSGREASKTGDWAGGED
jgi:hypothetical protein